MAAHSGPLNGRLWNGILVPPSCYWSTQFTAQLNFKSLWVKVFASVLACNHETMLTMEDHIIKATVLGMTDTCESCVAYSGADVPQTGIWTACLSWHHKQPSGPNYPLNMLCYTWQLWSDSISTSVWNAVPLARERNNRLEGVSHTKFDLNITGWMWEQTEVKPHLIFGSANFLTLTKCEFYVSFYKRNHDTF